MRQGSWSLLHPRTRWRIRISLSAAVVAVVSLLSACGSSGSSGGGGSQPDGSGSGSSKPIEIAFVGELSGDPGLAAIGAAARAGTQLAVYEINKAGGIDGRPVQLSTYDTQGAPDTATAAIRQALSSQPAAVVGFVFSSDLVPSTSAVTSANIPWVVQGAIYAPFDQMPFFFAAAPASTRAGKLTAVGLAKIFPGGLSGRKVAIAAIGPSVANDERIVGARQILSQDGASVAAVIRDPVTVSDWSSQAQKVVSSHADAVIGFENDSSMATIVPALATAGFKGPIVDDLPGSSEVTFKTLHSPNYYAIRDYNAIRPGSEVFDAIKSAQASTDAALGDTSYFTSAYSGMYAVVQTLTKCGLPCSTEQFSTILPSLGPINTPIKGSVGRLDFSKNRSGVNYGQLWRWDSSKQETVPATPVLTISK